jgi:hypothetical protein
MTIPKDFMLLEPLLTESLQDYLGRHGLKLHTAEHDRLVANARSRWRKGPAWATGISDWRTREQKRQDELRAQRGYGQSFDAYGTGEGT